jgi:DNA-directed RNA polymerase specialized sigma24 family protein
MQQLLETRAAVTENSWDDLLAGARAGDIEMTVAVQEKLKPGIRVLLSRRALNETEDVVMERVLSAVVDAIRAGEIRTRAELARVARLAISNHLAPRCPVARQSWTANPSAALNNHLTPRERDMMRRFYVLAQDPVEICREMGVPLDEFTRVKSLARAAVAVSLAASRHPRPVLVSTRTVSA